MLPIPCSMSYLRLYMMIWVPHKKMAHSDQDLTHLKFSDSFSKSPFCGPKCQIIVTLFLAMLDNWFWCLTPGFWVLDIYMMLRSIWRSKTGWRGCKRLRTTSRSEMVTLFLNSEHARDLFLVSIPGFLAWQTHWDHFKTPKGTKRPFCPIRSI